MNINLADFEILAKEAVAYFWQSRDVAKSKQVRDGKVDYGERSAVTAGKNMDGFITLIRRLVLASGLDPADVCETKNFLTLPGYYRPTKSWDLLIVHQKVASCCSRVEITSWFVWQ